MKKVLFMLAMLTCIFASCSDGDSEDPINPTPKPEEVKAEITIDSSIVSNGLSFEAKAGENSISFTTNANWTLTVAPTTSGVIWCKASIINGTKGSATVKFTVEENTSYEDRSVSVTIKTGTVSKTFTITQKAADALLVTTNKFEVAQEGGKIDVEVKANIDYQIEITETAKSWISETSSRTLNTYKHSFTIAANEEADKREGEITFKSGDKVDTVKVYQVGGAVLLLSRNECTISDAGGSVSVDVKSNVEYGVQMPDVAWITDSSHSHGRGMSSHTLEYIVEPNENYDNRSAEIIFYDLNSELKDTLKVVQTQKNAIIISKKEFELNYKEQSFEIELLANVEFNVVVADSAKEWINHIETRSLDSQKLTFNVKENDTFKNRNGNIYIWNKESSLIDTIKINQSTLRFTLIDESELGQYYIGGSMLLTENGMYIATKTDSLNYTQVVVGDLTDEDKESCIMAKFNDKGQLSFISYKEDSYYLYNYRNNMVDMISNENGNFSKSELDITELLQNINGKGRTSNEGVSQNHYWEVSSWIFFFWKNIGKKGTKIALELLLDRVPLLELVMGEKAKDFKETFIEGIDLILDYFVEMENKENELKLFLYDYMAKSCKTHTLDPEKISNFTYRIGMSIEGANTIPARFKENTMYGLLYCKSNSFLQGLNVYDNFNYVIFGKNPENGSLYATLPDLEPGYWYYYRAFIIPYYETYNIKQQSEDKYVLSSGSAIDSYIYYGELKHFNISHGKITDIQEVEKSYFNSDYMHFPIKVYAEHYFEDIPDNPLKEWGVVVYKDNEKMSQHTIGGASINDPNVTQSDFGRYKNIPRKGSVKFPVKINKDDMRRIENTYTAVTKNEWSLGVYCYISNTAGSSHLFYEERWPLELTYDQKPIASTGTTNSTTTNSAFVEATYTNYSFWNGICGIEYTSDDGNVQHVIAICEENKPIEIPLTDLQPNTTYSYRAYIEVEGEKIYGDERNFTTLSPSSLILGIENIKCTSADVICSFMNGIEGAESQILITSKESDMELIFSAESDKSEQKIKITQLAPATNYIATSRIVYKGIPYYGEGNGGDDDGIPFRTLSPSGSIIKIDDDIKANSVTLKCQFKDLESGAKCAIVVVGPDNFQRIDVSSTEEKQTITINNLTPNTNYVCFPIVELKHAYGEYYYEGDQRSFVTDYEPIPDLTGKWIWTQSCIGDNPYQLELKLDYSDKEYVCYRGSYGAVGIYVYVYAADRSCYVTLKDGSWSCNNGKMNESFTYASGDSHSWVGGILNESWSLQKIE